MNEKGQVGSIDYYNQNIRNKSQIGLELASNVLKEVDINKFQKLQRFDLFLNKIDQLYKSEIRQ